MSDFIKKIRTATGDKEIDYEALANRPKIPKKVSDLENDTGFITEDGVPKGDIPTRVSELENDSGFITDESVPKKVSELQNDTGFVTGAAIPTSLPQRVTKKSITLEPSGWEPIPLVENITLPASQGISFYNGTGRLGIRSTHYEMKVRINGQEYTKTAGNGTNIGDFYGRGWLRFPFYGSGVVIRVDDRTYLPDSSVPNHHEPDDNKFLIYDEDYAFGDAQNESDIEIVYLKETEADVLRGWRYKYSDKSVLENSEVSFVLDSEADQHYAEKIGMPVQIGKSSGNLVFKADGIFYFKHHSWIGTSYTKPTNSLNGTLIIRSTSNDGGAFVYGISPDVSGFITDESVPTKVSDLENDVGYVNQTQLPTKVSDLENDSGFVTSSAIPTKTSDLINDSNYPTRSEVNAKIEALQEQQSAPLKLTAPNGDVYVVSVSDSGQIVLTKQASATNLITSPITLTANTWHNLDYSLGLEVNKYYTVQIKFTNADGTETVKSASIKALDMSEDVGSQLVVLISEQTIDPNVMFVVYDKIALVSPGEGQEPNPTPNENAAVINLSAGESYAYTSAVLESITEAVLDPISFPLTIMPSSMTWSLNEDRFISKPYSGSAFDTSKAYNVIGSIVIGGTTYELSVSNEAPIIYGLYDNEDPYIEILVGDDDNHRIYIRSANGYVTIELKSYADESTTCTTFTIDSITEGGSPLAGEWATPVTFADASTSFSKGKKYTYSGTIGLENNKPYKLNVTVDGTTSDVIMWANTGWNEAGNQPQMSSGYNTTPKLPDFTDCRSHIGGEHYEADRCMIEFGDNITPGYTSLTINSITEADTAPNGAWSLPMTVNMPESYVSECMFSFSGTFGLEKGKAYKITTTEGETQREYVGIAKAENSYNNVIILDTTPPVITGDTRILKLYDNATLVGETSSSNVHEFTNRCAVSFEYSYSISSIVINSITEIEIPTTGAWSVPQTYSSLTENATSGYTYSGLIGLAEYTSYKINVTIDGTTKDITSTYNGYDNGTVYCNFNLDDSGSHYIQIRDKSVYLSYGDSYRISYSDNNCSVIIHNGSYSSITINSITKVTA